MAEKKKQNIGFIFFSVVIALLLEFLSNDRKSLRVHSKNGGWPSPPKPFVIFFFLIDYSFLFFKNHDTDVCREISFENKNDSTTSVPRVGRLLRSGDNRPGRHGLISHIHSGVTRLVFSIHLVRLWNHWLRWEQLS